MTNTPTHAYLPGKGKVRILSYHSDGYFWVLTSRDERVFVHRNRLKFMKERREDGKDGC